MIKRRWELSETEVVETAIHELAEQIGILYPTAKLLWQRGVRTQSDAKKFLLGGDDCFFDPFTMRDMEKAVTRVLQAVERGEQITIYGDYDVDGITSVSVLYLYLREVGAAVNYYIPERLIEGYGMNVAAAERLAQAGTNLVITVDNGITACEEIAALQAVGVDVVVTDHHTCRSEMPKAVAVVDPHRPDCDYPFSMLAGVGVVFKLICAIEQVRQETIGDPDWLRVLCEKYLDLVALGTIADVMPLVEENRLIVRAGLANMEKNCRAGLRALLDASQGDKRGERRVNAGTLGFAVAPRINAAGRLASATLGAELFLSEDGERITALAEKLCELNRERQATESALMEIAQEQIGQTCDLSKDRVLVLAGKDWHPGVIGIVASRLCERYGMPTIMISIGEDGIGKGSGRSPEQMNLVGALAACEDTLVQFGGHALAAGLTVREENIPLFRERINAYASEFLSEEDRIRPITVDLELGPLDLTLRQAKELLMLEPFGTANPAPVFVLQQAQLIDLKAMGHDGKHSRLYLKKNGISVQAVCFGRSPAELVFRTGDYVDAVFSLDVNTYGGKESAQLNVRNLFRPVSLQAAADQEDAYFARLADTLHTERDLLPNRTELSGVYLWLRQLAKEGRSVFSLYEMERDCQPRMRRLKLRICLSIFAETPLLTLSEVRGMSDLSYQFTLNENEAKQDLTATPTYQMVAAQS